MRVSATSGSYVLGAVVAALAHRWRHPTCARDRTKPCAAAWLGKRVPPSVAHPMRTAASPLARGEPSSSEADTLARVSLTLALSAAVLWGVGDFCGGLAARRSSLLTVLFFSQLLGLAGMAAASLLLGGTVIPGDLLLGAIGGIAGALGVTMLYRSLSIGLMTLIAPVTGVIAAGLPVIVGIVILGERLSTTAVAGVSWPSSRSPS